MTKYQLFGPFGALRTVHWWAIVEWKCSAGRQKPPYHRALHFIHHVVEAAKHAAAKDVKWSSIAMFFLVTICASYCHLLVSGRQHLSKHAVHSSDVVNMRAETVNANIPLLKRSFIYFTRTIDLTYVPILFMFSDILFFRQNTSFWFYYIFSASEWNFVEIYWAINFFIIVTSYIFKEFLTLP